MERIIKVNGVEIVKGLCNVEFRLGCSLFDTTTTITHRELYDLLDSATSIVPEEKFRSNELSTAFVKFNQGSVVFIAYTIN
jgi:hypothetical protein